MHKSFAERFVCRARAYHGGAVNFRVDRVRLPNGRTAPREYIDHPGAAAVVPVLGDKVVLVRQYRYPVGKVTLEIPAGKLDARESPRACILRELEEETGYRAGRLRRSLRFWPAPAFSNETLHIFVADRLAPGTTRPDEDEFVEPLIVPLRQALGWIRSGKIKDAKTIIGLLAYSLDRPRL